MATAWKPNGAVRMHGRRWTRGEGAGKRNGGSLSNRKEAHITDGLPVPGGLPRSGLPTRYHDSYFKGEETKVLRD